MGSKFERKTRSLLNLKFWNKSNVVFESPLSSWFRKLPELATTMTHSPTPIEMVRLHTNSIWNLSATLKEVRLSSVGAWSYCHYCVHSNILRFIVYIRTFYDLLCTFEHSTNLATNLHLTFELLLKIILRQSNAIKVLVNGNKILERNAQMNNSCICSV